MHLFYAALFGAVFGGGNPCEDHTRLRTDNLIVRTVVARTCIAADDTGAIEDGMLSVGARSAGTRRHPAGKRPPAVGLRIVARSRGRVWGMLVVSLRLSLFWTFMFSFYPLVS